MAVASATGVAACGSATRTTPGSNSRPSLPGPVTRTPRAASLPAGWSEQRLNPAAGTETGASGLSCPTTSFCVAVSAEGLTYQRNGTSWVTGPTLPNASGLEKYAVSCGSASFCVVLAQAQHGEGVFQWLWNGSSWTGRQDAPHLATAYPLDCTSTRFCMASHETWDGATWKPYTDSTTDETSFWSCVSEHWCAGVSITGATRTWNGTEWHEAGSRAGFEGSYTAATELICATRTFCFASSAGVLYLWNGTSWTKQAFPEGTTAVRHVSCASASFCAASLSGEGTDSRDEVAYWDGGHWSVPEPLDEKGGRGGSVVPLRRPLFRSHRTGRARV